jgi:hypothetical protein
MGRSKAVNWRATQRAARISEIRPYTPTPVYLGIRNLRGTHPRSVAYPCSYCPHNFRSQAELTRHVVLSSPCRERHMATIVTRTQVVRTPLTLGAPDRQQPDANSNAPKEPLPSSTFNHASTSTASAAEDAPLDESAQEPSQNENGGPPEPNGSFQNGHFVEPFPDDRAGAPTSNNTRPEEDLRTYIEACGRLGKQANFENMELLMTTGLSNAGRDRHLKSRMVSLQLLQSYATAYQLYPCSTPVEHRGQTVKAC